MKNFNWNFVLAIVAALATMFVVVMIMEFISHDLCPPTEETEHAEKDAFREFLAGAPVKALVLIPLGWVLGAFAGAFVGANIHQAKRRAIFFIVAIFTSMAGLMMMIQYPSPWYFWVISAFIFPAALLGSRLIAKNKEV